MLFIIDTNKEHIAVAEANQSVLARVVLGNADGALVPHRAHVEQAVEPDEDGEARRLVDQGGVMLNNARVDDPARRIGVHDLASETILVLRIGKKRYFTVKFV